ncbi:MAG: hypothetical protein ABJF56_10770 [Maribacter dokdonensis]|uniref:hypothetical protein n=2 Tax=Maribacter dokdonensis TaxID=320912 RepID=UPI003264706D
MKAIIFFIFFIFLAVPPVFGQIKIGDNPQNIDASSVLELESSSKVLVITRVNTLEMEAITPQRGGLVYNTDTECVHYYDGTQWVNLCDAVNFTITNDPIINGRSTIEITESAAGYNLEVAENSLTGDNIRDGFIDTNDIADNSLTADDLAAESVGSSEIRENAVGTNELAVGAIQPVNIANESPDRVLTTDENGIVQWEDANDLFDLTFDKTDNTLTISRSTTPGVSSISLEALVGSDDQQLDLTENILSIENDPNTIDLSTYFQTLSFDPDTNGITLSNGNTITLPAAAAEVDGIVGNEISNATDATLVRNGDGTEANPYTIDVEVGGIDTAELANNAVTTGKIANNAVRTADILNGTILPEDIAPSAAAPANAQILSTSTTGVVGWIDIPEGAAEVDGDIRNELQDLDYDPVNNILTISTPLTALNQVDLSGLADAPELDDGFIFVGNAASEPTPVDVGGDVTMNNLGQFSIENNTIESNNIVNNTITLEDLNQNGAADGQVIKWDETLNAGLGAWTVANDIANGTGANITDTDANDGLSDYSNTLGYDIIVDDATIEIVGDALQVKEDAIGLDQLNPMGATTNGQILKWNQDNTQWELGTDANGSAVIDGDNDDALTDFNATTGYNINVDDTTIEIVGDALQVKASATNNQVLQTIGGVANWQDLTNPANTGSILFSDGTGGIAENNAQLFWDNTSNRLGIGTVARPLTNKLSVDGTTRTSGLLNSNGTAELPSYRFSNNRDTGMYLIDDDGILGFTANNKEAIRINDVQNVGIGPTFEEDGTTIAARLHVDGDIRAEGAITASGTITGTIPDYVFQKYFLGNSILNPSYKFKTLAEIEAFLKENNHLPGIQSAQAVKEQGFWNVSESSRVNLEKIEELFLHTIEQEKKIKELQKANTSMSSELEALKTQMEEIKTMLLEKQND